MDRPDFTTAFTGGIGFLLLVVLAAGIVGSLWMWGYCSRQSLEPDARMFMLLSWLFGGGIVALVGLHFASSAIDMGMTALRVVFPKAGD